MQNSDRIIIEQEPKCEGTNSGKHIVEDCGFHYWCCMCGRTFEKISAEQ